MSGGAKGRWSAWLGEPPPWIPALLGLALLLPGLSSFGIWDPWELEVAERARAIADGGAVDGPAAANAHIASYAFRALGVGSGSGRLPMALAAAALLGIVAAIGGTLVGRRTGLLAALILASLPGFVLNARSMFGAATAWLPQALLALCLLQLASGTGDRKRHWLAAVLAVAAFAIVLPTSGLLCGGLPVLWACAAWPLLHAPGAVGRLRTAAPVAVAVGASAVTAAVVIADRAGPSLVTGGMPMGTLPATFDLPIEVLFHGIAPWSAVVPACVALFLAGQLRGPRRAASAFCLVWAAGHYVAYMLFVARYGEASGNLPLVPLSLCAAIGIEALDDARDARWPIAVGVALAGALLVRDYAIYPEGVLAVLARSGIELPEGFDMRAAWAGLFAGFVALAALLWVAGTDRERPRPRAMLRGLREQWNAGLFARGWMTLGAVLMLAMLVFGAIATLSPGQLRLSTLIGKWVRRAALVPLLVPLVALAMPQLLWALSRIGRHRSVVLAIAGLSIGLFTSQVYLPRLSAQLSPRSAYQRYNALAGEDESLAEYKVGGRAAAFYAKGEVVELETIGTLVQHLRQQGRTWATLPGDQLPALDRAYRKATGQHVFVADAQSAKVILVSSQPVRGVRNENYLAEAVLDAPPDTFDRTASVRFGDGIALIGYDLDLPHEDHVGAGESLHITWYFRVTRSVPGNYQPFVHIDGPGRVHGDHEPVDGKYPVRLWRAGDVIADRHKVDVPATTRPGRYTIYMGFFSGSRRLPVKDGPQDGDDRAKVGVLDIR